jgi:hypothetical protein
MKHTAEEAMIRQRTIDIVLSIRPLRSSIRPSDTFIRDTRKLLLGVSTPVSLTSRKRQRALARLEDQARKQKKAS